MAPQAKRTGQPVPHHPAAGGEIKDSVLPFQVGMEHQFFELVDQDAGHTLDHAFGQAGGARGIHDVKGMVGRDLDKIDVRSVSGAKKS